MYDYITRERFKCVCSVQFPRNDARRAIRSRLSLRIFSSSSSSSSGSSVLFKSYIYIYVLRFNYKVRYVSGSPMVLYFIHNFSRDRGEHLGQLLARVGSPTRISMLRVRVSNEKYVSLSLHRFCFFFYPLHAAFTFVFFYFSLLRSSSCDSLTF